MSASQSSSARAKLLAAALAGLAVGFASTAPAQVVINEISYDDAGNDNLDFIELYNSGAAPIDISNWVVRNSDEVAPPGDDNLDFTVPASTSIPAGGYYVLGMAAVANVKQVISGGTAAVGPLEDG